MAIPRLVLALALVATTASAQKYTRQPQFKIDTVVSERAKPAQPKPKPAAAPEVSGDTVLALEIAVTTFRKGQQGVLVKLIGATPDSDVDEKADLYFRLGELYAKQQRMYRLQSAGAAINKDGVKAAAFAEQAKHSLVQAVRVYKALTDNEAFRNFARMDLALFYYGYTLQGGKYMTEARAVFDKLLKNYPNSRYVADAHLVFADYHFDQGQLADAEARYKMVLKFPRSSAYWYAMYRIGWIDLNLARFQEALEVFFRVAQATKNDANHDFLHRAANKDFVRAYAEIGKSDKAFLAFKRVDQKYAFTMLGMLADFYMEQGKSDKGIYVYRELMRVAPHDNNVCAWQYNVAQLTLSLPGASTGDKVTEIENLNRLWSALGGTGLPPAEAQDCRNNAAAMSGELARAYHSEAVKTQNAETFGYAERLYKAYLDTFPTAADNAKIRYYYAELLWSREQWEKAAVAFTDAIKTGNLDKALQKECAYAAVLAWMRALKVNTRPDAETTSGDDIKPRPIPDRQQTLIAAFDLYISLVDDMTDNELIGIKFLKANVYRRYNHFDKANPIFKEILANHAEHETAEFAANLLLDTYNRQNSESELIALTDRLLANQKFLAGKDDLALRAKQIKRVWERRQAERFRGAKDFDSLNQCGMAYLEIYNRDPIAKDNDEVLYNAGVCFEQARSIEAAIRVFNLLQKYYSRSKLAARAIVRLGKAYGDIAMFDKAADKLEAYAKKYAGENDAYDALNDAVVYRKGNGEDEKAIENTKYLVKMFAANKPAEAANAAFSLTSIYEKQGDSEAVVRHLRDYIRVHGAKGGYDKLVIAHAKIGRILFEQSCPVKAIDGACVKIVRSRAIAKARTRIRTAELPAQCGPDSKTKMTVVKRDQHKLREALAEFVAASRDYTKVRGDAGDARHFVALGKLAEADVALENYFDVPFPANLDFDPRRKAVRDNSLARFDRWFERKTKLGGNARVKYDAVLAIKDSAGSIAADARIGQLSQHLSDTLFTAEVPKDVRAGEFAEDKVQAYCDQLTALAEPLEAKALEGYGICLTKSTELGWFSEWSRLCERELGQIKPEAFPTATELRGESNFLALLITVEPPPIRSF